MCRGCQDICRNYIKSEMHNIMFNFIPPSRQVEENLSKLHAIETNCLPLITKVQMLLYEYLVDLLWCHYHNEIWGGLSFFSLLVLVIVFLFFSPLVCQNYRHDSCTHTHTFLYVQPLVLQVFFTQFLQLVMVIYFKLFYF